MKSSVRDSVAVLVAICAASAARAQTLDLSKYRMIDLTHSLNAKTLYWPTSPTAFKLDSLSYGPTPG